MDKQSQFIEMFKGGKYPIVKANDVCDFITKGTTPASSEITTEPKENSIPYLKVYNLSFDGSLLFFDAPQYISREIHEGKLSRSKVYPNDVLMNIVGPPLGKFSLVTDGQITSGSGLSSIIPFQLSSFMPSDISKI